MSLFHLQHQPRCPAAQAPSADSHVDYLLRLRLTQAEDESQRVRVCQIYITMWAPNVPVM